MQKRIPATLLCACMVLSLLGCTSKGSTSMNGSGSGSGTSNVSSKSSTQKVKLTFTYWGGADEVKSTNAAAAQFEKDHPNITISPQNIPTNYLTKLNTMAASGTLPDVGYLTESSVLSWAQKGALYDVSTAYTDGTLPKKLDSTLFQLNGKTVCSSVADEVIVLYYNKKLFEKAGLDLPPASADKAWTWDQFLSAAQKLTTDRNGKHPTDPGFNSSKIATYGINIPVSSEFEWLPLCMSNGGGLTSKDGKTLLLDQPETTDVIQDVADLINKYHVMPSLGQESALPTVDTALLTGQVAMVIDGQWDLQVLGQAKKNKNLDYGIGVLPMFKTPVTTNTGTPIVIFNTTKHPDEAKTYFKYLMDPNSSLSYITSGLWMPNEEQWYTDDSLINKWTENNNAAHPSEYKTAVVDYALKCTQAEPWYNCPTYQKMVDVMNPALQQVWLGKATAADVVKNQIMPKITPIFNSGSGN